MPGQVVVEVMGDEMIAQELVNAGDRGADMLALWPRIIGKLEQAEVEQFASEGARGPSGSWPENTHAWQYEKFSKGQSLDKMKATEAMFLALTTSGAPAAVRVPTNDTLAFGADLQQFGIWQSGYVGNRDGTSYPIDLTPEDEASIGMDIMEWTVGALSASPRTGRFYYSRRNARGQFSPRDGA